MMGWHPFCGDPERCCLCKCGSGPTYFHLIVSGLNNGLSCDTCADFDGTYVLEHNTGEAGDCTDLCDGLLTGFDQLCDSWGMTKTAYADPYCLIEYYWAAVCIVRKGSKYYVSGELFMEYNLDVQKIEFAQEYSSRPDCKSFSNESLGAYCKSHNESAGNRWCDYDGSTTFKLTAA